MIVTTRTIFNEMQRNPEFAAFVNESLRRFRRGDWGDVSPTDAQINDDEPEYALGAYRRQGVKIWIKQDGENITVLYPSEY